MEDAGRLREVLRQIDGSSYGAYKRIKGVYQVDVGATLHVDYVQGDPFAAPSRVRIRVTDAVAGFPEWTRSTPVRRVALADFLTRAFDRAIRARPPRRTGSGKSGLVTIEAPAQEVLPRTSVVVADGQVEARFRVGLPARGRRVLGRVAAGLLLEDVPAIALAALRFTALDESALRLHVATVEDQEVLRGMLADRGLVAFVPDGARLPRRSGVDPGPMEGSVVPFESPASLRQGFDLPNRGRIQGMGIPDGVTLIVGGGYHGKSTLLAALELGVYDHVPGDGRELVVARADAVKIRAEDGRRVERVDISPFIRNLPFDADTTAFSTDDASGSTSQAANIVEALEVGARVLLMDEDTSATNFMIRDHRMQQLVAKEKEPITPFIDRVRRLVTEHGVSSVLVVGGAGDYFDVADTVIMMDTYRPRDVTERAKAIADQFRELRRPEGGDPFPVVRSRVPAGDSLDPSRGRKPVAIRPRGRRAIDFGTWTIDLSAVEQLVEGGQAYTIAETLLYLKRHLLDGRRTLADALTEWERRLEAEGLDLLAGGEDGGYAMARRFEVAAALNRLRSLRVRHTAPEA